MKSAYKKKLRGCVKAIRCIDSISSHYIYIYIYIYIYNFMSYRELQQLYTVVCVVMRTRTHRASRNLHHVTYIT